MRLDSATMLSMSLMAGPSRATTVRRASAIGVEFKKCGLTEIRAPAAKINVKIYADRPMVIIVGLSGTRYLIGSSKNRFIGQKSSVTYTNSSTSCPVSTSHNSWLRARNSRREKSNVLCLPKRFSGNFFSFYFILFFFLGGGIPCVPFLGDNSIRQG